MLLEKTLESPLDGKEIKPVSAKELTLSNCDVEKTLVEKNLLPLTARRSNQSILKEINLEYS